MSFTQLPDDIYVSVFESNGSLKGAVVNPDKDGFLTNIVTPIYINGTGSGTEKIRLKLHSSSRYSSPFATSNWILISDIPNISTYWIGLVRFDFARTQIDKDVLSIYTEYEIDGYTRSGDTFYIGTMLDWPEVTNSFDGQFGCPIKQEWYLVRDNGYS